MRRLLTAQGDIVTTAKGFLCPKEIILGGATVAEIATNTTRTQHGHLTTILLSKVCCLESWVVDSWRDLLQCQFVHALGGDQRYGEQWDER